MGVVRDSRKFSGPHIRAFYGAHRAVIFAITQLSCLQDSRRLVGYSGAQKILQSNTSTCSVHCVIANIGIGADSTLGDKIFCLKMT